MIIDELKKHGNITVAAKRADISRKTIWQWRQKDRVFDVAVKAAIEEFKK